MRPGQAGYLRGTSLRMTLPPTLKSQPRTQPLCLIERPLVPLMTVSFLFFLLIEIGESIWSSFCCLLSTMHRVYTASLYTDAHR
jgi:hypothetical protein